MAGGRTDFLRNTGRGGRRGEGGGEGVKQRYGRTKDRKFSFRGMPGGWMNGRAKEGVTDGIK
jgi:hypothetical protein